MRSPRLQSGPPTASTPAGEAGQVKPYGNSHKARSSSADPNELEWAALVQRIAKSRIIQRGKKMRGLFQFLWDHRTERLTVEFIEKRFYGDILQEKKLTWERTRVALSELRAKLLEYTVVGEKNRWHCLLPSNPDDGVYGLTFILAPIDPVSASQRFWSAHLARVRDTIVVTGSHLFSITRLLAWFCVFPFTALLRDWKESNS